jgi:hypothetical protein
MTCTSLVGVEVKLSTVYPVMEYSTTGAVHVAVKLVPVLMLLTAAEGARGWPKVALLATAELNE